MKPLVLTAAILSFAGSASAAGTDCAALQLCRDYAMQTMCLRWPDLPRHRTDEERTISRLEERLAEGSCRYPADESYDAGCARVVAMTFADDERARCEALIGAMR